MSRDGASPAAGSLGTPFADPPGTPLVTIGMPVYNGARYLEEAIASLQAQTEDDFILHISDNCSDDTTPEICARLAAEDPRIRYECQERNLGAVGNFQYLLRAAGTPFFMWAAHDDLWAPTFLATSLKLLRATPGAVACSVGVRIIDENGTEVECLLPPPGLASSRPLDRARAVNSNGHMAIYGLIRREALPPHTRVGDHSGSATAFVFTMALNRPIVTTDEILFTYRLLDATTKRGGAEAHLYDDDHTPSQMYRSMAREIDRTSVHFGAKARLRLHLAGRWLASARWANVREIRRAWATRRYGIVVRRLPAHLILGPSHAAYLAVARFRRQITALIHR